jgi:hypothetical protein
MRTRKHPYLTVLALALALAVALSGCGKKAQEETEEEDNGLQIGYATKGVVMTDDPDALQKAYDEAVAEGRGQKIGLLYQPEARSTDGVTFQCHIGNSTSNVDDLFLAIYGDPDLTDELFLSELLRPGTAFEEITLEHSLPAGRNTVYAAFTTVVQDEGELKIHNQAIVTIDFIVNE